MHLLHGLGRLVLVTRLVLVAVGRPAALVFVLVVVGFAVLVALVAVLATALLVPRGHFVGKLFQGPGFAKLVGTAKAVFGKVRLEKPAGSRKDSIELYVVGMGKKA